MLLDAYAYFFINIVLLDFSKPTSIVLGITYGILLIIVFVYGYKATVGDPTDPTIYAERAAIAKG
jgi:hypothetical protein